MDVKWFLREKFIPRTEFICIPELKKYFDAEIQNKITEGISENEAIKNVCGFKVRSLTGQEFGRARQNAKEKRNILQIAESILSEIPSRIKDALKELFNATTSQEEALAIELFCLGVVEPEFKSDEKLEVAVKLFQHYPVDLLHIATRIQFLTGAGSVPGER